MVKGNMRKKYYNNSVSPFIPALWAQESLAILEENMVIANLVHRDFTNEIANFGDTVNTRRPGEFQTVRKGVNDDVTIQDATSVNVQVKLNQMIHVSFLIRDGEQSLSFKDLVTTYMKPAMLAQARFVDQVLLGQYQWFLKNASGTVGNLDANVKNYILDTRKVLNVNKAYPQDRRFILSANAESSALKPEFFTSAEKVGDNGTALRTASLGHKLGFDFFMSQNTPSILGTFTSTAGAINNASGYSAGSTVLTVDDIAIIWQVGDWIKLNGLPYQIIAHTETSSVTTSITLSYGLRAPCADNDVITRYTPGQVNLVAGYAAGWYLPIAFDTFTGTTPQVGQVVTFGLSATPVNYTVIQATSTTIVLDRPLEVAVADNDLLHIGMPADYSMAFHKNALALVSRPFAPPMAGAGAMSSVAAYNGFSMRATIAYLAVKQGHLVTLDGMFGIKLLDANLGALLVS